MTAPITANGIVPRIQIEIPNDATIEQKIANVMEELSAQLKHRNKLALHLEIYEYVESQKEKPTKGEPAPENPIIKATTQDMVATQGVIKFLEAKLEKLVAEANRDQA